jgi:hypothetical protein
MPYIGRSTDGFGVRNRFLYLASADDTSVSGADANGATLTFSDGAYVDVYLNGVLLKAGTDYNTNTANTIAGLSAMSANDEVTVIVYDVFTVGDMVSATSGGTFVGNVTHSGTVTVDDTTDSTSTTTGSIQTDGGVGIAKDLVVGDDILLKSDSSAIQFGADSEITLTHRHNDGLVIKHTGTGSGSRPALAFHAGETEITSGDVLGKIEFQAPDEASGTDAVLIGAEIRAVAEDTFAADNNETRLEFRTGNSEAATTKMSVDSDGKVGIGITTPRNPLDFGVTSNNDHVIALRDNNTSRTILGLSNGYGARVAAPHDGTSTENMFEVGEIAGDGTTYQNTKFAVTYAGNASIDGGLIVNESGSSADFRVESDNNANMFTVDASHDRIGIGSVGQTNVGVAIDISPSASTLKVTNATDDYQSINIWSVLGNNTADTNCYFYAGYAASAHRYFVAGNGNVTNVNNSYGAYSDEKLKENISDASSQWDDIKGLKVRNFSWKRDSLDKANMIGLIAQEAETVSPNLIEEEKERDSVGEIIEGQTTKTLKYSVLYMKAVKALQEAMTRIETLEAKVKALEEA